MSCLASRLRKSYTVTATGEAHSHAEERAHRTLVAALLNMGASGSESEPQPGSAAWSSTPAAAAWRAAQPQSWPATTYAGHLKEPRNYSPIALMPPPRDVIPEIEPLTAYAKASRVGGRERGPTIFLAVADLSERQDVLVYVLHWEDVRWAPSGPPERVGPESVSGPCVVLIDATTGSFICQMMSSR